MGEPDSTDDLGSIFEGPEPAPESPPASRLGALIDEFRVLDRRRLHAGTPLDPAETQRLAELEELLAYEFGAGNPPLAGSRRRSLRVPTQLKVNTDGGDAVATLRSLSHGGAFLETSDSLTVGTVVELVIDPGGAAAPLRIAATVKWVREIANMDGPAGVGVAFEGIEDDDFIAVEKLLARALDAWGRRGA